MTKFVGFEGAPLQIHPSSQKKESEEQKVQPWLNTRYEEATESVIQEVQTATRGRGHVGDYLGKILEFGTKHPIFKMRFDSIFSSSEAREKIYFEIFVSASASEVTGKKIRRGVFIIDDDALYEKLHDVFVPGGDATHGVYVPGSALSHLPAWRDTGILVMKNQPRAIDHEIRHSVDPNENGFMKREGYDQLLSELFAEYHNFAVKEMNWQSLAEFVAEDSYFKQFSEGRQKKISREEWWNLCGTVVKHAKLLSQKYGHVETQRMIVTSKTVEEFLKKI